MQNKDRAKIFMPFDALKGFSEVIKLMEKNAESKKTFSEDMEIDLNNKINSLSKGNKICIKYYCGIEYIETIGIIKRINKEYRNIELNNCKINFDDILDINMI